MIPIIYLLACVAFYESFVRLNIVKRSIALFGDLRSAMQLVSDKSLSDLEKERGIRRAAIDALSQTLGLFARLVIVAALAALPVLLAIALANLDFEAFSAFSLHPAVLVSTVIAIVAFDRGRRALRK
jgi:hypothetical protein